ncbi:MAG: VCBS repeat-containing protein [Verrucomicrobiota bacterium]|nr:VCBS repeat-containing protein [Verrucomicrobiota bacterium]
MSFPWRIELCRWARRLLTILFFALFADRSFAETTNFLDANRLTYLDSADPFYPNLNFPKLITPQWIGEPEVEAVVVLAIDDMNGTEPYEKFLRPILERLKKIDGRAPVSIMTVGAKPDDPQLQTWLKEGLSIEVHTLTHPCPLFANGNFDAAAQTVFGCFDLMGKIPGNKPVAYRMPCCDSINSLSPRFFAEIFNYATTNGNFLHIDSSVMNITTTNDPVLPHELTTDSTGKEKFRKYIPFPSFTTTIENYPYPYVIGKLCWEFPGALPSDWEAQNIHGKTNPITTADWKAALDITVLKQGTFNLIFHPYGWSSPAQIIELIDYATDKYGNKIKFLNFREAQERLNKNLLSGQPLRSENGEDNGVRLLDLNNDGFMDVIIGNETLRRTRIWNNAKKTWSDSNFPISLRENEICFGVVHTNGFVSMLVRNETFGGGWHFNGAKWIEDKTFLNGLEINGEKIFTQKNKMDRGVRFRDLNNDGRCELIVGNENKNAIFSWSPEEKKWQNLPFALPEGVSIVDKNGRDNGLRFIDLNGDGFDDIIFQMRKNIRFIFSTKKILSACLAVGQRR